jgi:hypothetical protein
MFDDLKDKELKAGNVPATADKPSPFVPVAEQTAPQPANQGVKKATGLEDIFSNSDTSTAKPPAFQPKANVAPDPYAGYASAQEPKMLINKLFILVTIVIALALLGGGFYWSYNHFFGSDETLTETEEASNPAGDQNTPTEIINNEVKEPVEETQEPETEDTANAPVDDKQSANPALETQATSTKDTDQDGLTDREEVEIGTNANSTDTDGDGLFDREEAQVYKTDPLNPDTDGDTYSDGAEVKSGYNPNGEGKLFNL